MSFRGGAVQLVSRRPSADLETREQRVAVIHEDRVVTEDVRPGTQAWPDASKGSDGDLVFDASVEDRATRAFVAVSSADGQTALAMQLRHPGRGSSPAGRSIDGLFAVKDRPASVSLSLRGTISPDGMMHAPNTVVLGVDQNDDIGQGRPQLLGQRNNGRGADVEPRPVFLRLDHGIEVAAIGDVHRQGTDARHIYRHMGGVQVAGDVE